jgi:S-adenosylmethionine:diacylglycerol 3-amino-3-carboxypropyl transferase
VALTLAGWWLVSRSVRMLPHLRRRPSSIPIVPLYILLSFAMAMLKIYALATIRTQEWMTRRVAVVDGEIVRTTQEVA